MTHISKPQQTIVNCTKQMRMKDNITRVRSLLHNKYV